MAGEILRKEGLPATTPIYRYQGAEECLRSFEMAFERYVRSGESASYSYILFDHVDDRSFQECFENDSDDRLTHALDTYDHVSQIMVLKMVTTVHEAAHCGFTVVFSTWHRAQESRLIPVGKANITGSREKCPDASWKTSVQVAQREKKWPTVVMEARWSESSKRLQKNMLFWLRESQQQVKVALTIDVTRRQKITIQQWSLQADSVRPVQCISITRNRAGQSEVAGTLKIPFEDCFLRPKGDSETDFTLSYADMTDIAENVWSLE